MLKAAVIFFVFLGFLVWFFLRGRSCPACKSTDIDIDIERCFGLPMREIHTCEKCGHQWKKDIRGERNF